MDVLNDIYAAIAAEGFTARTLQMIDNYAKDIQNGREDFSRFNLSEHAGLCKGGSPLIGASIVACYATASLRASCDAEGRQGQSQSRAEVSSLNLCRDAACARSTGQGSPANWEIDEQQEKLIEQWAKAANLWEDDSEHGHRVPGPLCSICFYSLKRCSFVLYQSEYINPFR